jgi:hypothetical protein
MHFVMHSSYIDVMYFTIIHSLSFSFPGPPPPSLLKQFHYWKLCVCVCVYVCVCVCDHVSCLYLQVTYSYGNLKGISNKFNIIQVTVIHLWHQYHTTTHINLPIYIIGIMVLLNWVPLWYFPLHKLKLGLSLLPSLLKPSPTTIAINS